MRRLFTFGLIAMAMALSACGSKSGGSGSGSNPFDPDGPPITDPVEPPVLDEGVSVNLTITSKSTFDQYTGWTTNTPTETKLIISLKKYATISKSGGGFDYSYGGEVGIRFKDRTSSTGAFTTYTDTFSSLRFGDDFNTVGSDTKNNKYNLLSSDYPELAGALGYHGFFEDTRVARLTPPMPYQPIFGGAVIVVIDSLVDAGDGTGPTSANGSVWFKNYTGTYPMGPLPETSCWFITEGPYDCRSWKQNGAVNTKMSIYPNNGYVKLGTFTNLDIKKAFNNEI